MRIEDNEKFLVIDTESIGEFGSQLCYDVGLVVADKKGNVYAKKSFVIKGLFDDLKVMSTAYYARRYNCYLDEIASGETKIATFTKVLTAITELIETFEIKTVWAYNESFDDTAMQNTTEFFFDNSNWLPENVTHNCIWSSACNTILDEKYIQWAKMNGFLTAKGNVKTSAEIVYRYLSGNNDFEEAHTGLDDCLIEVFILSKIFEKFDEFESAPVQFPMRKVYELDRNYQIGELERKEAEAVQIVNDIQKLFNKLRGRMKTIQKWRDKLGFDEESKEFQTITAEITKGFGKKRIAETESEIKKGVK